MPNIPGRLALLGAVAACATISPQRASASQQASGATAAAQARGTGGSTPGTMASVGAPTPDSLARLVVARFAEGSIAAFDSVYPDALGRGVMRSSVQRKTTRDPGQPRVLWTDRDHAVLLLTPTVRAGTAARGAATGGDETNTVRRLAGLYEAVREDGTWRLVRQIPLDTANRIQSQRIHADIVPGHATTIVDTLGVAVGSPYGLAVRLNNAARLTSVRLDGRDVDYRLEGGVLWIDAPRHARSQLALRYTIPEDRSAKDTVPDRSPAFGALHNTDAWHPFFNYDSGNDFATLSVTATIPAAYQLTTSVPQTESVANGTRTVRGESMHPQFLLSLIYDKEWRRVTTRLSDLTFETLLTPRFRFSHDSLATLVAAEYRLLTPRFGEPQAPSRYLVVVEDRALKGSGFTVRMNNAVVSGDNAVRLDEPTLGPSDAFAHEVAHGWTMNASGYAANFLQEGWATFGESLVLGAMYGPSAERAVWERLRTAYVGGQDRGGFLGGFEGRQSLLGDPDNGRIHYYKGSWILHSLEHMLGDKVFDRGLRSYIARAGKGPNGYEEFIAAMSEAAGRDMAPFIMPWLTEKFIPDVDARVAGEKVIVTQSQPSAPFDLPLDIELVTSSGVTRRAVHLTGRADTLDTRELGTVSEVRVDPDHHFLLKRHWGDIARFQLRAPEAKTVELMGSFLAKPVAATRSGDLWTIDLPLTEGRYLWLWRVDGVAPSDDTAIAAAKLPDGDLTARAGVRFVKPVRRLPEADAR